MKYVMLSALAFCLSVSMNAQVKTPAPSPRAVVKQTVGLTEVEVEYNRPSARGRAVFGDLVPFGRMWRTGANLNSMISFGDDVTIDGKKLPKGKYAIFTIPRADMWDVFFYTDTQNWGVPEKWDESKVALSLKVKPETLSRAVESFTISINNLENDFAHLELMWEKMLIAIKFEVPTRDLALNNIKRALAGPSFSDFYSAAQFYYSSNIETAKALEYVNQAIDMVTKERGEAPFWYLRLKSLIQARNGDRKGAIETARQSLASAEKVGNQDYIKMNRDSIAEWSKK